MSLLLLRRKCTFTLSMLKEGQTISRKQYKSLYEKDEFRMCFSIHSRPDGCNMYCTIRRQNVMGTRELFGKVYDCPVPTSNNETFSFYVEGTESL